MENQPELVTLALNYLEPALQMARAWLVSPAAWSQAALLLLAWALAWALSHLLRPRLTRLLTPPAQGRPAIAALRRNALMVLPLMLPLLAYALTGIGETLTRRIFGAGEVIAFGQRLFLFLAVRIVVRDFLKDPLLRLVGRYVLLPVAAIYALGLLDELVRLLETTIVPLGNMSFNLLWLLQGMVAASVIFWLGRWSNDKSASYIQAQEEMRPATRQLAAKAAEIAIFGIAFLVLMNIMGIPLTSLAVLGHRVGRPALIAEAVAQTDACLAAADIAPLAAEWRDRSVLSHQTLALLHNGQRVTGSVVDLDPDAGLILRRDTGELVTLPSATTTVVTD